MVGRRPLRARQRLGKYRIERRLAEGGFATVYQAVDTIEGIRVALKIPHADLMRPEVLEDFRREVRLAAQLEHPNILPVKDASFIDGTFVIVFPLGDESLGDRLRRRLSTRKALELVEQLLDAVAYAHRHRVMHLDIKPDNLILDGDGRLRLTDFGVARVSQRTIQASGSGTLGYIAPEQAMGKPSLRSDVFSIGLIACRLFTSRLPTWPYDWPPPEYDRLRRRLHPDMIALIRRAMEVNPRKRYRDADHMRSAFRRIKPRAMDPRGNRRRGSQRGVSSARHWQHVRRRQFRSEFGKELGTRHSCSGCNGPVAESMLHCPWCGVRRQVHGGEVSFPARCPRCERGIKLDWRYCPWCWGAGFAEVASRIYSDRRYEGRCANPRCDRKDLMPFMRYCPWCHASVKRAWKVPGSRERCGHCGWGLAGEYWNHCPWCGKLVRKR